MNTGSKFNNFVGPGEDMKKNLKYVLIRNMINKCFL